MQQGFARVRCADCHHEYLLDFSCKGRWLCPSCHQKKVQLFGALVTEANRAYDDPFPDYDTEPVMMYANG